MPVEQAAASFDRVGSITRRGLQQVSGGSQRRQSLLSLIARKSLLPTARLRAEPFGDGGGAESAAGDHPFDTTRDYRCQMVTTTSLPSAPIPWLVVFRTRRSFASAELSKASLPFPTPASRPTGELPIPMPIRSSNVASGTTTRSTTHRAGWRVRRDQTRTAENREAPEFGPRSGPRTQIRIQDVGRGPGI